MSATNFAKIPEGLLYDTGISPQAVRLYGILQRYSGKSGNAFPSREELAGRMGTSIETVKRCLADLASGGWVERTRRPGSNVWDTRVSDAPQVEARVTSDPTQRVTGDPGSGKHGSPVTLARVTSDPTVGSPVTRLEEREPLNESQLTRVTAAVAGAPTTDDAADAEIVIDELPLGLEPHSPQQPNPVQILVGAYVSAVEADGGIATQSQRSAIGRNVKRLIDQDHIELPVILIAVQRAAAKRSRTVDPFLGELQSAWNDNRAARKAMRARWYEMAAAIDSRKDAS